MTDAATPAAPAITLETAMSTLRGIINAQPDPARTDLTNAFRWLEPAIETEVDAAIMSFASKIPVAGSFIGGVVSGSINKALEAGLVDLIGPQAAA